MMDLPDLALSICQPWAWAIVHLQKDIENRSWSTRYRGPICIHASKGMTQDEYDETMDFIDDILPLASTERLARRARFVNGPGGARDRGKVIGTAEIVDCVEHSESPWFFGRYGFVLRNAKPLERPISVKGKLGMFEWRHRVMEV